MDKVYAFVAPVIVGGETSLSPVEGSGVAVMANAWRLAETRSEQIGPDWLIIGYPRKQSPAEPDQLYPDQLDPEEPDTD